MRYEFFFQRKVPFWIVSFRKRFYKDCPIYYQNCTISASFIPINSFSQKCYRPIRARIKAGVNLKFAQKLSFLFSSEFAALGIQLRYGKIIFYLFSLFLPFWAISKFPLWLMVWLPWQREEHFLIFQLFMMCYSGNQAPKRAGFNERYFM